MRFDKLTTKFQQALADGLHLTFAIPDHPWVDSADGAAVRIAMTVGTALKSGDGRLLTVTGEREAGGEGLDVTLASRSGKLHAYVGGALDFGAARRRLHAHFRQAHRFHTFHSNVSHRR